MLTAIEAKLEQEAITCLVDKAKEFANFVEVFFLSELDESPDEAARTRALDAIEISKIVWDLAAEDIQKDFERKRARHEAALSSLEAADQDGS